MRIQAQLPTPGTSSDIYVMMDINEGTLEPKNKRSLATYNAFLYRNNTVSSGGPFQGTNTAVRYATVNGSVVINSNMTYDFRASSGMGGAGATVAMGSGSIWIGRDANGNATIYNYVQFNDGSGGTLGNGSAGGNLVMTRLDLLVNVKDNSGVWQKAILWVKDAGTWKKTRVWVKDAGVWKSAS